MEPASHRVRSLLFPVVPRTIWHASGMPGWTQGCLLSRGGIRLGRVPYEIGYSAGIPLAVVAANTLAGYASEAPPVSVPSGWRRPSVL